MDYAQTLLGFLPGASRRTPGLKDLLNAAEAYLPPEQVEGRPVIASGNWRSRRKETAA